VTVDITNTLSDITKDLQNQGTPVSEINDAMRDMLQREIELTLNKKV